MRAVRTRNQRISPGAIGVLTFCTTVGYSIVMGPKQLVGFAGSAAPLGTLLGLGLAVLILALFVWMADQFPHMTIYQWSIRFLGRPLGYPFAILLILYLSALLIAHGHQFTALIQMVFLPHTPFTVITVFGYLFSSVGSYLGLETLSRFSYLILYAELITIPALIIAGPAVFRWTHFLPWYPQDLRVGLITPLIALGAFLGFAHAVFGLRPYVQRGGRILRPALLGFVVAALITIAFTVSVLGTFGPDVMPLMPFPSFEYTQVLDFPRSLIFVSRYSLFFGGVWVLAIGKLAMIEIYLISLGISQVFGIPNRRGISLVVSAVLTAATALTPFLEVSEFLLIATTAIGVVLAMIVLPVIALAMVLLRKRVKRLAEER